jgi:hypothetical protein
LSLGDEKNEVFDLLGADGNDIEALTAYALYKRHKRSWATEFEVKNSSKPKPEDDAAFARAVSTPDQLDRYRKDAQDILIAFANQTVDDARREISEEAITARIERAAREIGNQGSFKNQVLNGVTSTAITTLVLIILVIGIRLFGIDLIDGIGSIQPVMQTQEH